MSPTAVLLIIVSAFTHAGWNLLSKGSRPCGAFFLAATGLALACLWPVLLACRDLLPLIPPGARGLLALTGFFMALYYLGLSGAYRTGDITLAYPLARSSPILVVTFVSFALGRGHEIGPWALAGIILVTAGCFLLPLPRFRDLRPARYLSPCCLLALVAATGTAGYTIIDDRALALMRGVPGGAFTAFSAAAVYIVLQGIVSCLWLGLGIALIPWERRQLAGVLRQRLKPALVTGLGIYFTYGLVLTSMAFVDNVSYVAAFRQLSIPIGAILGFAVLHEPRHPPRIAGIAVIFAGLVMVGLG